MTLKRNVTIYLRGVHCYAFHARALLFKCKGCVEETSTSLSRLQRKEETCAAAQRSLESLEGAGCFMQTAHSGRCRRNVQNENQSPSQSHISTDGLSVCLSWCRAPSGAHDQILVNV
jgi:hypothetical protein